MYYSERLNLLFIAAPKTGSSTVESVLLSLDQSGETFKITLPERTIDSSHVKTASLGHATATELRGVLGAERYGSMTTIGFVRHPIEILTSAYYYTRELSILRILRIRTAKSKWKIATRRFASILLARLLPFSIWACIYPMKRCSSYFLDSSGCLIVDYLGSTGRLSEDLLDMLNDIGVDTQDVDVPHLNRSSNSVSKEPQSNSFLNGYLLRRYAVDLRLHDLVAETYVQRRELDDRQVGKPCDTGLSRTQSFSKRVFDMTVSAVGLLIAGWIIVVAWLLAMIDTGSKGFFIQDRVGRHGRLFKTVKIRTMRDGGRGQTNVTTSDDPRITALGRFWRRSKIDELPQLWNVLIGNMSFVGPRPDVPGFADLLSGNDRVILAIRPGITGPATLKYRNEESLLAKAEDPETYNRDVIYPDKVKINKEYVRHWSFWKDIRYILATLFGQKYA